jgi:alcohol dehydrogenase (NADP+)
MLLTSAIQLIDESNADCRHPSQEASTQLAWRITMVESSDFRDKKIPLNHGLGAMPALGFGTLIPDAAVTISATKAALEAGFRHFDCAERYRNEREVGEALQAGLAAQRIARDDIFVTTKLWNTNHRPERVEPAFQASLERLRLNYLNLYLIHTPFAFQPGEEQDPRDRDGNVVYDGETTLLETWRAMENLVDGGRCRAIGLSDVSLDQLVPIYESSRIKPAVVQVESHPYLPETELLAFCREKDIVLLAFAPLGHGMRPGLLDDPVISAIAARVGKTPAQVLLAWAVQRGTALLTTPRSAERARENFNISPLPQDAFDEIHGIQIRQRLNDVVKTGSPGFIPRVKSA